MTNLRVVARNIDALLDARARFEKKKTVQQKIADAITKFAGSMWSVYIHGFFYIGWWAMGWDLVALATIASVEAIFLTTFVLISQNRMGELADRRADLDLQINLLSEHEITRLLDLCVAISSRLGVEVPAREEVDALRQPVAPEHVIQEIEDAHEQKSENASVKARYARSQESIRSRASSPDSRR